ncbi:MAG: DEAD/DEAH box helicase [Verrucomicrobia bacterium]|nr:DEAD/DEAH box helicase [Verrucomicrobiota bacterium]
MHLRVFPSAAARARHSGRFRMLRLLLPPNLPAAAIRDAIPVKVEFDPATPPPPAQLPALALLSRICGGAPTPPPFVQLTRTQLRELVAALSGQPVFAAIAEPAKSLLWLGPRLRGVSEHLTAATPLPATPPPPAASAGPRSLSMRTPRIVPRDEPVTPMQVDGSEHFLAISLPSREAPAYAAARELLSAQGFALDPSSKKWWLRDRHKVLNFLAQHGDTLRSRFHADFTPNFDKNAALLATAEVETKVTDAGNGEFSVTVGLAAGKVTEEDLRNALATGRRFVEDGKKIYLLPPEQIERLAKAQAALAGGTAAPVVARKVQRVTAARIPELQEMLDELSPDYQPPAAWRRRAEALRDLEKLEAAPLPPTFAATLRPYQHIGVAWLWHLHRHDLGGILADEMGLGKTAQAIALLSAIAHAAPEKKRQPSLVVCPASLVENWRREAARFAPALRVFVHHGSNRLPSVAAASDYDMFITSYGTLGRDSELFSEIDLATLIADEAQHAKNRRSLNARALRSLHARSRLLLTGTPVENSLEDLRTLFEIVLPGYVDAKLPASAGSGVKTTDRDWQDERLRRQTAPYILRRTKSAVATELPPKIEQVIHCTPTSEQLSLYNEYQRKSEDQLNALAADGASENSQRMATLTQLLRLRQICCDPRLVEQMAEASSSSKLEAFRELLAEAVDDGHRLLVFSQFTSLLGLLRDELDKQELTYCYLDGSTPQKQRQAEVDRYNTSPDIPVFLISLKAGGTGLNLTGADTVVHFDPWWNPAAEAQATDRAHRIGQTKVVTSYKLICTGTVEEKVMMLQDEKRRLLADVFEASDAVNAKLTLADLRSLLVG